MSKFQDLERLDEPRAAGTHRGGPIIDQLITVIIAWYTIRRSCYRFYAIGTLLRTLWMGQHCRIIMPLNSKVHDYAGLTR